MIDADPNSVQSMRDRGQRRRDGTGRDLAGTHSTDEEGRVAFGVDVALLRTNGE